MHFFRPLGPARSADFCAFLARLVLRPLGLLFADFVRKMELAMPPSFPRNFAEKFSRNFEIFSPKIFCEILEIFAVIDVSASPSVTEGDHGFRDTEKGS